VSDKPVVLVAEDDPSVRMAIEFVLKYEGFDVIFAQDGEEALQVARESVPDCILLDQVMPKMDGKEVLGALKRDESTSGIPILVLSGVAEEEQEEWPGADFVGKPFSPDDLIERIRTLVTAG
jgi:two-component system alkaline phosphatase synthesis response regulator PhoP